MHSRLLWLDGREPRPDAALITGDPSNAQFQLWLAQAQRDHGNMNSQELSNIELAIGGLAKRSKTMFNPFTGELRKVEY